MNWGVHNCARDRECRTIDPAFPKRVYFYTPRGSLIIALDREAWTQVWLHIMGYTDYWWPIVWHPRSGA